MTGEHRQPFPTSPPQTGFLRKLEEVRVLLPTWETERFGGNYIYIKFWILFFSPWRSVVSKNNFNGNGKLMSPFGLHNRILSHQALMTVGCYWRFVEEEEEESTVMVVWDFLGGVTSRRTQPSPSHPHPSLLPVSIIASLLHSRGACVLLSIVYQEQLISPLKTYSQATSSFSEIGLRICLLPWALIKMFLLDKNR